MGNGLPRNFEMNGWRRPLARNTRNAGAVPIQGLSGIFAAIALRIAASRTTRMSLCCRSLFDGADSAQAHSSRTSSGDTGRGK